MSTRSHQFFFWVRVLRVELKLTYPNSQVAVRIELESESVELINKILKYLDRFAAKRGLILE